MLKRASIFGASCLLIVSGQSAAQSLDVPQYPSSRDRMSDKADAPVEQEFKKTIAIEIKKSNLVICSEGAASGEDLENALAACDAAIEEAPQNGDAHYYRGFVLFHLERFEEAEQAFTSAIELGARRLAESYYQRGACKEEQRRLRDAAADFKAACELKPDWSAARRKVEEYQWAYEKE